MIVMSRFLSRESPPEPPETPKPFLHEAQLRYFKAKNKNKNSQDVHNSASSNISSNRLPNFQNHDVVNSHDSSKLYNSDKQNANESITTIISEHIVKHDNSENSVTNNTSYVDLSIPSLHLKSLSRSDSEFIELQQNIGSNSKFSSSLHKYISNENVSEAYISKEKFSRKSSKLPNNSVNEKVIVAKGTSKNDNLFNNNDRICNKNLIHTLFNTSSSKTSDKLRNSIKNYQESKEIDFLKQEIDSSNLVESEIISSKSNVMNESNNNDKIKNSSVCEEVIKVDIRGTATRGFPFPQKLSFFSNSPSDSTSPILNDYIALNDKVVNLTTLGTLPRMLQNHSKVQINLDKDNQNNINNNNEIEQKSKKYELDCEIEGIILNKSKNTFQSTDNEKNVFTSNNGNKPSIQKDKLLSENKYLSSEVSKLQQLLIDVSSNAEAKGQLSDFTKHKNLIFDENSDIVLINTSITNKSTVDNFSQTSEINSDIKNYQFITNTKESDYAESITFLPGIENYLNELNDEELLLFHKLKNKLENLMEIEFHNKYETFLADLNYLNEKLATQDIMYKMELKRFRDLIVSIKSSNPDLLSLRNEMVIKHQKEIEELRTYFEKKCADMEKHYSEEVFSTQSKKISINSSTDSLNNCLEALLFDRPFNRINSKSNNILAKKLKHSHSFEFCKSNLENSKVLSNKHNNEILKITEKHNNYVSELITYYEIYISELEEKYKQQIADLKADLQTYQNTEMNIDISQHEHHDTDLELEKALILDHNSDLSAWPLNLIALKEKIEAETKQTIDQLKMKHEEELTSLREENNKQALEVQKYASKEEEWRSKRQEAFDRNRHLEDVIKERDGLKHMIVTLQKVLSQLVEYFNLCEDELNNTVVGELLKQVMLADENFDNTIVLNCTIKSDISQNQSSNNTFDENNISTQISKKISFVPNVNEIMTYIDVDCSFDGLNHSQDISLNFKHDLDSCLKKLRTEAQELLALSAQRIPKRLSILGNVEKEVVCNDENIDSVLCKKDLEQKNEFQDLYEKSEVSRKELEESLAQSMYQEIALKRELQIAMEKIAELLNESIPDNKEIDSEGYGIVTHSRLPVSLPPHPRVAITAPPPLLAREGNAFEEGRSLSLDGILDKRGFDNHEVIRRLTSEIDAVNKEKEDLQMQLEAANKQLKSTRQFLEEQAAEREQERDEYQSQLEQLKEENSKLSTKTQHHTCICKEVNFNNTLFYSTQAEQLETQIREMTCLLTDTENKRNDMETDLKSTIEKSLLLRNIIGDLEVQLEKKTLDEARVLEELKQIKEIAEEKEIKMREMAKELEMLRDDIDNRIVNDILTSEKNSNSNAVKPEIEQKVIEQMRGQLEILVNILTDHTVALENVHEAVCSQSCSSPSEDVSIRNQKKHMMDESLFVIPTSPSKLLLQLPLLEITRLGDTVHKHLKAEDAAVQRIRDLEMQLIQLKDVAQELRAERDILQERMSEQSLRISSLQSRLDQTRHTAEQIRHQSTEELRLQLDEAHSEIQLLRESLDSRDKQVVRLKSLADKTKNENQNIELYEDSNKNIVQSLKKELSELQLKHKELEEMNELNKSMPEFLESIVADKNADIDALKQKLQAVLKLNINDEEILKELSESDMDVDYQGQISGRMLSDILSISEFDESELMRKAELKPLSCISENLHISFNGTENQNLTSITEIEEKLPLGASTDLPSILEDQDDSIHNLLDGYKRNINETTVFGASLKSGQYKIEECELTENSLFPKKNTSAYENFSVEPKILDFSFINLTDGNNIRQSLQHELSNLSNVEIEELFKSFKEYGIEFKLQTNHRYNILVQILNYVNSLQEKLEVEESSVKNLEKQFNELLNVQNEVEKLREGLQNNFKQMDEDKLYYNVQFEKFVSGESMLKNQLQQAINDSNEKANELQILKEDIVRRENLVLELSKEKRNLQKRLFDLEQKEKIIESKYKNIDKENVDDASIKDNITYIQGLETLILEKNQQIDNLNVDLDKLNDVQKELNNKKIQIEKLQTLLNEKSVKLEETLKVNNKLTTDEQNLLQENYKLSSQLKEFTEINSSLKDENGKLNDGLQILESKLTKNHYKSPRNFADKDSSFGSMDDNAKDMSESYVKIEDFENFFNELNNLIFPNTSEIKSSKTKKWDFNRIKAHITKLEVENNFNRKDLNETVFKLEKAKLEIIDFKTQTEELFKHLAERDELLQQVSIERDELRSNLEKVIGKLREESNLEELNFKLNKKVEECNMLEQEVISLKKTVESFQRDLISDREKDNCLRELCAENGRLKQQLSILKNKITEQDVLISDLNEVKENLIADFQELEEKSELEKDTSVRLKLLLDSEKQMANSIQNQDSNVIQILKDRLEVALDSESELKMLLEREKKSSEQYSKQLESLKKQLKHLEEKIEGGIEIIPESINVQLTEKLDSVTSQFDDQVEITDLLKSEIMLLNSKRDRDKSRLSDLQNVLDREKLWFQKEIDSSKEQINSMKHELSELMRQKHEMHLELVNSREKLHLQRNEIVVLEKRLSLLQESNKSIPRSESYRTLLNDLEKQNKDLVLEIASLKSKLELSTEREKFGFDRQSIEIGFDDESSTLHHLKEMQLLLTRHIKENAQISETVKELTQERRELQRKVRQLEELNIKGSSRHATSLLNLPEEVDQQVRFLYGSYMRVQSYRKALIWQKRYLTNIVRAFEVTQFEFHAEITPAKSTGIERWRRIVISIQSIFRMKYLVRRWQTGSKLASNIHLNIPNVYPSDLRSSKSFTHIPSSLNKKEARSRHYLQNPSTSHYTLSTRRANKSWSMGSALNLAPERIMDRQNVNISYQSPLRNTSMFRENVSTHELDNWNSINDQPWLRTSHQELPHFNDDVYPLHSPTSENDMSSANSGCSSKFKVVYRPLNSSKD